MRNLALAALAVGLLTLMTLGSFRQGARDAWNAVTHWGYYPYRDMRTTVAIKPQKTINRIPDAESVPVTGREWLTDRDRLAATLVNPTAPAELDSSIARGQRKFAITCTPCHGPQMRGDGTVAQQFMPPPDLLGPVTRGRRDGYIYSYIRNGGVVMPTYGPAVSASEAWDLVNYVRHMQKVSPR
jgi:mono/diheme cytochrome c family protein